MSRLASAVGVEVPVLELRQDPEATTKEIIRAVSEAIERHGAEVIILGCTGLAPLAADIRQRPGIPVVEPAAAALGMLRVLLELDLGPSRPPA